MSEFDFTSAIQRGIRGYGALATKTGGVGEQTNSGRSNKGSRDNKGLSGFITSQGEVYGFVDKDGNIYLDETVITPEHPIHEYTHLWDRTVAKRNPKLWNRGVELMQQTSLWKEIEESKQYGALWKSQGIEGSKLTNLIASEVH